MARISIEDCQKKLPNRFALVMTAAHRARQLLDNAPAMVKAKNKEAVLALREIAEGRITMEQEELPQLEEELSGAEEIEITADSVESVEEGLEQVSPSLG